MIGPFSSTVLPPHSVLQGVLRVATYNIHKGVRGVGPNRRLEIHNLGLGIEALDADLVFLQEVRHFHRRDAARFDHTWFGWPDQGQADFLAPEGFSVAYRTNAVTRHGEHGNALLSRWPIGVCGHVDVSNSRFEQRGLLHVPVQWEGTPVHAIVTHLSLTHASRVRQVELLQRFIAAHVPDGERVIVAGDFNDWSEKLDPALTAMGLERARGKRRASRDGVDAFVDSRSPARAPSSGKTRDGAHDRPAFVDSAARRRAPRDGDPDGRSAVPRRTAAQDFARLAAGGARIAGNLARLVPSLDKPTFPSRVPVFALDRIYTRGLRCLATYVPRGPAWTRMSDHLPLVAEFECE
jgi:endonuclease/exonuclease/phosphatase family metal-dependent hydrolase